MSSEQDVKNAVAGVGAGGVDNPWPARLAAFKKFAEQFHERGASIERRYEDNRDDTATDGVKKVNMFYSNVTIIKESLFNSLPKPVAKRIHDGEWDNDVARVAATIVERGLTYEVSNAPVFEMAVKSAIVDRLVPGLGVVWVNFNGADGGGLEHLTVDTVYWKDFIFEPQRTWSAVTWVGRKLHVSPDVARQRWGERAVSADDGERSTAPGSSVNAGKVCVIQMWDKNTRKVHYLTESGQVLNSVDDPYKLKGFFPCPRPLIACPPTSKFLPMPDYYMAQDQYMQLDILYTRIGLIIESVRAAGVYNASIPSLSRLLSKDSQNVMIPVDNWAMFAENGGVKGSVDWYPVEQIATVLNHLVSSFSFIKNQLFEVTGMADIIRGSSNQYETLGAQQIKAQFASVRMNGFQRDVSHFVRDLLRIMAELQTQLYSRGTLSKVCGVLPQSDQQYVDQALALLADDRLFGFSVDIQPDSLTQADWSLQQEQRMAYGQSLSQFLTAAIPASEQSPELVPLFIQIIKFMSVGFKGSSELEGTLDQMLDQLSKTPPAPQEPQKDPAVVKAETEAQIAQQRAQMEGQIRNEEHQQELAREQALLALKEKAHTADLEYTQIKHAMELSHAERMFDLKLQQESALSAIKATVEAEKHEREESRKDKGFESELVREGVRTHSKVENERVVANSRAANKEKKEDENE